MWNDLFQHGFISYLKDAHLGLERKLLLSCVPDPLKKVQECGDLRAQAGTADPVRVL